MSGAAGLIVANIGVMDNADAVAASNFSEEFQKIVEDMSTH
jgi:hypothetical protein